MHRIQILFLLIVFMVFRESIGQRPAACFDAGGVCIHDVLPCPTGRVTNDGIRCCGRRRCCVNTCNNEDTPCESVSNGYCIRDASNCAGASFPLPTSIPIFECCSEEFTYCCVPLPVQLRR